MVAQGAVAPPQPMAPQMPVVGQMVPVGMGQVSGYGDAIPDACEVVAGIALDDSGAAGMPPIPEGMAATSVFYQPP